MYLTWRERGDPGSQFDSCFTVGIVSMLYPAVNVVVRVYREQQYQCHRIWFKSNVMKLSSRIMYQGAGY